ncbi:Polyadenylate-binding protein-interacting protein 4 [Linum grandiflorum]
MGCPNRIETDPADTCASEALLIATLCIIGLPVDVHIRDGSVYSGIFHTAYGDKDYGVVLKHAKLTKKGNCNVNIGDGSMIETLVIYSSDLVQVVARGVLLPADGINGSVTDYNVEASVTNDPSEFAVIEAKELKGLPLDRQIIDHNRQIGDVLAQVTDKECNQKLEFQGKSSVDEGQYASTALGSFHTEVKPLEGGFLSTKMLPYGASLATAPVLGKQTNGFCDRPASADSSSASGASSGVSVVSNPVSRHNSLTTASDVPSPQSSESNRSSKEFKLNPEAKIFCPSFASSVSAASPAVTISGGMPYAHSNSPILPVPAPQPEVVIGPFAPRPSVPAKIAPYNNLIAGNGGNNTQFSQHIVGHMGSRTPPLRYAGQYHTVPAGPAYVPPNSPPVMVGRLGQLVYMQPVAHDLLQNTGGMSGMPVRPLMGGPHQVQYPKHQGNVGAGGQGVQVCVPPPFVQQPFAPMAAHIPLLPPPIPANRHTISVPASNALFGTRFP